MKRQIIATVLLISFSVFGFNIYAQRHTTIIYRYDQDAIKSDSFKLGLLKIFDNQFYGERNDYVGNVISFEKKKDYSETICNYTIKDTTCAIIADGFGRQTFVIPGDTMIMNIGSQIPLGAGKSYFIPWMRYLTYEGKNKYVYSLFDSLSFVTGELRYNHLAYKQADKLDAFCEKANIQFTKQNSFLERYCNRYNISTRFKEIAKAEIFAVYINNLLTPLNKYDSLSINAYSKLYRETLLKTRFNDQSLFFNTAIYSSVAFPFSALVLPQKRTSNSIKDSDLQIVYNTIKRNYSDSIRNYLLVFHLTYCLRNPELVYPSFDSLLTDFKNICKNPVYTHLVDSLYISKKVVLAKRYSLKEAMSSQIVNTKKQQLNVKQLFKTKPVLLICWASWCAPCLREIPVEKKMQDLYGDKVDFVYLSFDKSNKLWQDKLKTLSIKNSENYILTDYFNSNFAHFYGISSIPFYLLYDKNRKRIEIKDLRPSNEGFKNVLEKLIH